MCLQGVQTTRRGFHGVISLAPVHEKAQNEISWVPKACQFMRNTSDLKFCTLGLVHCAPNWILEMTHMSSFLIRRGGKPWQVNFCEFFMNFCEFFIKFCRIFINLIKKKREKLEIDCFFPLPIKEMGHLKNPLLCTVDKTQGAKIQIWGVSHKLTSFRNTGNFISAFSCTEARNMTPRNSCLVV